MKWMWGLVAICMIPLAGCSSKTAQSQGVGHMEFRVPVTVAQAAQKAVPVEVQVIGNVETYSTVSVRAHVAGEVERVYFTQGQDVKEGQLLFTLDRRPFETTLHQLEANLSRDEAQLALAKLQDGRSAKLADEGIISKDQFDSTHANEQALEATVRADRAAIENAKVNLSYCSIDSPLDGRTGSLLVYPGNIAKADDTVLVVINQIHPIYVTFAVPEQYLAEVKKFRAQGPVQVEVSSPNDAKAAGEGELTFIDNAVDTTTGTIKMRATFPNQDNHLWPGQYVNVAIKLTTLSNATVVPSQAVQTGMIGKYLYAVKPDMTAEYRQVVAGETVAGETVIEKGVAPGESVVTDGQLQLAPGAKVELRKGTTGEK